jgi:hypothetical protein
LDRSRQATCFPTRCAALVLKPDAKIENIWRAWRHKSPAEFTALRKAVNDLVDAGIFERLPFGVRPYVNNPVLIVEKKNELGEVVGYRLAIDARMLNGETLMQRDSLAPYTNEVTRVASRGALRTKLDFASYFMQFLLMHGCEWLTASQVSDNSFIIMKRMLPGLHGASATAQAYSTKHFDDEFTKAYVDDVITTHVDPTEESLLAWLTATVDKLIRLHVTINATKCRLFFIELTVLGHTVGHRSIRPLKPRLDALSNYEGPHDRASLQRFLALARYTTTITYRTSRATRRRSCRSPPRTRGSSGSPHQRAFEAIKQSLLNCATLSEPMFDEPIYIVTDASRTAAGWLLEQFFRRSSAHCRSRRRTHQGQDVQRVRARDAGVEDGARAPTAAARCVHACADLAHRQSNGVGVSALRARGQVEGDARVRHEDAGRAAQDRADQRSEELGGGRSLSVPQLRVRPRRDQHARDAGDARVDGHDASYVTTVAECTVDADIDSAATVPARVA